MTHSLHLNELPFDPLPGVLAVVDEAIRHAAHYPSGEATHLIAELADRACVDPTCIVVGPGGTALIQQTLLAVTAPGDEVVFGWPAFDGYPLLVQHVAATPVPVPLLDGHQDLDAIVAAITPRTRLIFVCTPHNPTGTVVHPEELEEFLARVPDDILVVLDHAYIEFCDDLTAVSSAAALIRDHANVAVLRTFSKAYGLAGLRIGYLVAAEHLAQVIRRYAVPFAVTNLAAAAALASLQAREAFTGRMRWIAAEREKSRQRFLALAIDVKPSQGNFLWLPLADSVTFCRVCHDNGILVRPGPGSGVRMTIGTSAANELFLSLVARFLRTPAMTAADTL